MRRYHYLTALLLCLMVGRGLTACTTNGFYDVSGQCKPCQAGYECPSGVPAQCATGWYSLGGATACTQCPATFYCATKTDLPKKCEPGDSSAAGATSCGDCPAGKSCHDGAQTTCTSGYVQTTSKQTYCTACPLNSQCSSTSTATACTGTNHADYAATSCPALTGAEFAATTQFKRTCPAGYAVNAAKTACVICTAGKYCDGAGAEAACSGLFLTTAGLSTCTALPSGLALTASTFTPAGLSVCTAGQYKKADGTCAACTSGNYCEGSSSTACPAGTYTNAASKMFCTYCEGGNICPGGSTKTSLAAGQYSADFITNADCGTGSYCPKAYAKLTCPKGSYASGATAASCTSCPAGSSCTTSAATTCTSGQQFSIAGEGVCHTINVGTKITGTDFTTVDIVASGQYCTGASCVACAAGSYCPDVYTQTACPTGYYCVASSTAPRPCPIGKRCTTIAAFSCTATQFAGFAIGSCSATTMTDGYYQSTKTPYMRAVPAGSYFVAASASAAACSATKYCVYGVEASCPTNYRHNSFHCTQCEYGKACYLTESPILERVCWLDTLLGFVTRYSSSTNTNCFECSDGLDCVYRNQYFPYRDNSADSLACPIGFYAKIGDLVCRRSQYFPTTCPFGYYEFVATTDATKHSSEKPRLCKSYVAYPGSGTTVVLSTSTHFCVAGTYTHAEFPDCLVAYPGYIPAAKSLTPFATASLCPQGFFCGVMWDVTSSLFTLRTSRCPMGTYARTSYVGGISDAETCIVCPPGQYCKGDSKTTACPDNYICDRGTSDLTVGCPAYLYYDTTATTEVSMYGRCKECPANSACDGILKKTCPDGYKCGLLTIDINAFPVRPGTYQDGTIKQQENTCPIGKYCPGATNLGTDCPAGFFQSSTGMPAREDCTVCSISKVCATAGATADSSTSCGAGKFCPQASPAALLCPMGTSGTDGTMETSCTQCAAGSACAAGSSASVTCTAGHYCLLGSYSPTETPCPDGTQTGSTGQSSKSNCAVCSTAGKYCLEGATSETNCETGYKCQGSGKPKAACGATEYSAGSAGTCSTCGTGKICPENYHEINPISCPLGYFMATSGSAGPCTPCPAGKYCGGAVGLNTATDCVAGQWSVERSKDCFNCPGGSYCTGGVKTDCSLRKYCASGSSSETTCGAGYYCPAKSDRQLLCPPGKYSAANADICADVTAGHFTKQGQSDTTMNANLCAAGYYCETGAKGSIHKPCPAGTFVDAGVNVYASCQQCTAGFYCPVGTSTATRVTCPAGSYCLAGSAVPTKCPRGTFAAGTGGSALSSCSDCGAGNVCAQDGLTAFDWPCDAGYYCKLKSDTQQPTVAAVGGLCGEGTYCPQGAANPTTCPSGKFNMFKGCRSVAECLDCPFGFVCSDSTGTNVLCTAGYYCPGGTSPSTLQDPQAGYHAIAGQGAQIPCIPGTYTSAVRQSACTDCLEGKYCMSSATSAGTDCPAGSYCPTGSIQSKLCPEGTYRASTLAKNLGECTACDGGKYCKTIGATAITGTCDAGFYCTKGAFHSKQPLAVNTATEVYGICPQGKYCVATTTTPADCGIGKFSPSYGNEASTDCYSCTAGKYCSQAVLANPEGDCLAGFYCPAGSTANNANVCQAGYYCPLGSTKQFKCYAGQYQDATQKDVCKDCTERKYCPTGSSNDGTACPQGYYCPTKTEYYVAFPCAPGTYGAAASLKIDTECTSCGAGKFCIDYGLLAPSGDCAPGYYCLTKARFSRPVHDAEGGKCTAGQICTGAAAFAPCPATYVCAEEIMSAATVKCSDGFKCGTGLQITNPVAVDANSDYCTPGKWCQGGVETNCLAKEFSPSKGLGAISGAAECLKCPYGSYCATAGLNAPTAACPAGSYCNSYQDAGTTNACSAGFKCEAGAIQQVPCPAGEVQTATGLSSCTPCTAANYCIYSSTLGTPALTTCPIGAKCPTTGLDRSVQCPSNTYQDTTGQTTCKSCTAGNFCDRIGMIAQTTCPAGYYCPLNTVNGRSLVCTPGNYCPVGSSAQVPCDAGKYCADYALSAPSGNCEAGYYCVSGAKVPNPTDGTTGNICPEGYYCPDGNAKTACAIGKYNMLRGSSNSADCLDCTPGKLCPTPGLATPVTDCTAGNFCPVGGPSTTCPIGYRCPTGSTAAIVCLPGTYQDETGKDVCKDCPAGSYCNWAGAITSIQTCPAGYYCPVKTANYESYPCPEGWFNAGTGKTATGECTQCTDKFYCDTKARSAVTGACADGYLCPTGSKLAAKDDQMCPKNNYCVAGTQTSCPANTYTFGTVTGATVIGNCMYCLPGKMCPTFDTGIIDCPAKYTCVNGVQTSCTAGKYCPTQSYVPISCPRGYYSDVIELAACKDCPVGKFCNGIQTTTPSNCDSNMVCALNSVRSVACTYGKSATANVCNDCAAGKWCWRSMTGNEKGSCNDGFICFSGSDSPTPFNTAIKTSSSADLQTYNGRAARGCYTSSTATDLTKLNTKCPAGKYMPSMGGTECVDCPPGYYCDVAGLYDLSTKVCADGYVCLKGATTSTPTDGTTGKKCPVNNYCPAGTSYEIACADGFMALTELKGVCDKCDVGFSCTSVAVHAACSTGNTMCVLGTSYEPQCPLGTYRSGTTCASCPIGLYCVDGRSEASPGTCDHGQCCTAGYLCTGGSKTPKPLGSGGNPCEAGYYCPEGSIAKQTCPVDKYIFTSGSRQVSDCTDCMEGFICTAGNPVPDPCPTGKYCPTGITGWLACPTGTFSDLQKNKIMHDCDSCPEGYLCNENTGSPSGISAYTSYPCPTGGYCLKRAITSVPCPYATYNNVTTLKASYQCKDCPSGYYCNTEGRVLAQENNCTGGQYCPNGTYWPIACKGGYFCSNVTGYLMKVCPANYYCPERTAIPIECKVGEYCPEGSAFPIKCVPGQISAYEGALRICISCPAGTYSTAGTNTNCEKCEPGYVCLGNTTVQRPWNRQYHRGYKCPQGAYCPAGSSVETLCSAGKYNPSEVSFSDKACTFCKANTFNALPGQAACLPCGDSATSESGWETCSCKGRNRAFLVSDSSCRCKPGYEYLENGAIQTDVNSKIDCQPIVYPRCKEDEIRSYDGKCKGRNDCESSCDGYPGTRSPTLGICQCQYIQKLDRECNKACRDAQPKMTVTSTGEIRVNEGSDPYNYKPTVLTPKTIESFNTEFMTCPTGKACEAKSVRFDSNGGISAQYGLSPKLAQQYQAKVTATRLLSDTDKARLLATSSAPSISNPVLCIHEGDSLVFEVDSNGHYPVYQKDSLLNSNPSFDYGGFKALAERAQARLASQSSSSTAATTMYFGYTFTTGGRYFFTDSLDAEKTMVVSVTKSSEKCPNEGAFVQPRTTAALSVFGLALNSSIMLEPDYIMLAIILVSFLGALALLLLLMKWVTEHMWKGQNAEDPEFRKAQSAFDFKNISYLGAGKTPMAVDAVGAPQFAMPKESEAASAEASFLAEVAEGLSTQKLEELDPFIIEKILSDYQAYKDYLQKELLGACEQQSKQIEDLNGEIDRLKFLLNERYEKLIALLKLDVDYTKLTNVKIKMAEEKDDGKKREKRIKPSDIKLGKADEKKTNDVLKQILAQRVAARVADEPSEHEPSEPDHDKDKDKDAARVPSREQSPARGSDMEDRLKKGFEERLQQMPDLSEFEKNKLRDELSTELMNMEYVLAGEREQQEIAIRRILQMKRRKPKDAQKEPAPAVDMATLTPEEKGLKVKVEKQIEDEERDRTRDIEQKAITKIQKSKDKLLRQLGVSENLSQKEKDILLQAHKSELERLLEGIKVEKDNQLDDLHRRLERRKQAKTAEAIQNLREEKQPDILDSVVEVPVEIRPDILESENIVKLKAEETQRQAELEQKHKEEKARLAETHTDEVKTKESELEEDLEIEVEKEMEMRKEKVEEKYRIKQQELEDQRRKLKDQMLFSSGDKDASQNLMEGVKAKEGQLRELVEEQKKEQDYLLDEKINRRRIAKQKKLVALKNSQQDMSIDLRLKQMKEKHELEGQFEVERIKEIVREMRNKGDATTPQELMQAFEQLWSDREANELAKMFGRQLAEKEGKLRALCRKNIEQKLMEKQGVKDKYKLLYEDLEKRRPTLSADEFANRQKELRVEEENDLKEMDIKEAMNQKKEEFAIRQELEEKAATELGELQDKLTDERLRATRELFGQQQEDQNASQQMRELRETIEREKDRKIKEIELDKKLILEKYENELRQRFNNYEDVIKRQRETERLIKEKKGNIERLLEERKKQMADIKSKNLFTSEHERQMIEAHQRELKALELAMENERNRQFAAMRERLDAKDIKREREKSYHKKKVAFMMGTVGKNVTLAQAITDKAMQVAAVPKTELGRSIVRWKKDMEEREKAQKTTTFETLQKYLENVGKFKEKSLEGIFLQGIQYQKYLQLMKAAKILQKKLEELHRIKANGALLDLKAALKIFAEDDFDRLKARPERIGGGFRCFDDEGNILWELFKFIHAK